MPEIRLPGPTRMIWGSLGCFWLAETINKGFYITAVLSFLLIPVLLTVIRETASFAETIDQSTETPQADS